MHAILPCRDAMAEVDEELTPLKKKLDDFGTFLSKVGPPSCTPLAHVQTPYVRLCIIEQLHKVRMSHEPEGYTIRCAASTEKHARLRACFMLTDVLFCAGHSSDLRLGLGHQHSALCRPCAR